MSEKAKKIIGQLTLEEKCNLCAKGEDKFGEIKRLGIEGNEPQDNPRGMADYFYERPAGDDGEYHPVAFPSDSCMAMSWDVEMAYETGACFARECRANEKKVTWLFRPGVNLKRSVLCGRNFQYFSEDPVLTGEMAGSYIKGLQENGVAATMKHYLCNNQEYERMTTNSVVSERALREVYLRTFEIAIKKGKPMSIMSSYNKVNGEWVNSNPHICNLLREELGYDGLVVSDGMAVHRNKVEAHQCGMMDLELAEASFHTRELIEAVRNGVVDEETINRSVERLLDFLECIRNTEPAKVDMDEFHEKARIFAERSMVLLKNDGILPLGEKQENLLVVGRLAETPSYMGGGSGHMNGYRVENYLDEIRKIVPDAAYAPGYELAGKYPPIEPGVAKLIDEAVEKAKVADKVIVFAGLGYGHESEGYDRENMKLPEGQDILLDKLVEVNRNVILVLSCGSVLDISKWNDNVQAVLYNGLGGEAVGSATVNVLFGKSEPGGRLAESWPVCEEHTPAYMNFAHMNEMHPDIMYGEEIYVGYRWYQKRKLPVLYPFGYGLSYTKFKVGEPVFSQTSLKAGEEIEVEVSITNLGERAGSQVVQLYTGKEKPSVVDRPERQLLTFSKVWLEPGETKRVVLHVKADDLRYFDTIQNKWLLEEGAYRIMIGTSCEDICHVGIVTVIDGDRTMIYTEMTPFVWFANSEKFQKIMQENFPPQVAAMMNPAVVPMMSLAFALPIYRYTEPIFGAPIFNEESLAMVLKKMNA